jgi:hypothetical protein
MNEAIYPDGKSDSPWPSDDLRVPVPDTSLMPGSDKAPPAAVNLLNHAVQGAHDAIDQLAGRAAPVARQLGESVSAAEAALHAKTAQLSGTRDEWVEGMRATVRSNPLACVAAAVALGAVMARIFR